MKDTVKNPTHRTGLLLNVIPNLSPEAPLGAALRFDSVGIGDPEEKLVDFFWIPAFALMISLVLFVKILINKYV